MYTYLVIGFTGGVFTHYKYPGEEEESGVLIEDPKLLDEIFTNCKKDYLGEDNYLMDYYSYYPGDNMVDISDVVFGGEMKFYYHILEDTAYTYSIYTATRELTKEEEQELMSYTRGQWTAGTGEGYAQTPAYVDPETGLEYFIDPYNMDKDFIDIKRYDS